jgi:hypothetical protein
VGEYGTILHYDGVSWAEMTSGISSILNSVWGSSPSDVFAVGNKGTILHYDGISWTTMNSGISKNIDAIWGFSSSDVITVGEGIVSHNYRTAPTIISINPLSGTTDVSIKPTISAIFSEPMDPSTINDTTFTVTGEAENISGIVLYSGTEASFTPSSNLDNSTIYTVTITAGATDSVGNTMESDYIWTFTTEAPDTTPPIVSSVIPENGLTEVSLSPVLSATFSEDMDPSTFTKTTFTLKDGITNTDISGTITYNNNVATFTPSANLNYNTTYNVKITIGVKDIAGNAMIADYTWSFITELETTAPINEGGGDDDGCFINAL